MKTIVHTAAAPAAVGPYSQAVRAQGFLFVSGQLPIDPQTGTLLGGDIRKQTARVMENLKAVLAAADLGLSAIVKATIFLANMDDFAAVNEVYASYFPSEPPARACVEVARLPKGAAVEIECIAAYS
jgi:2-iminobutanoate/2-iminopropanoate deaminase